MRLLIGALALVLAAPSPSLALAAPQQAVADGADGADYVADGRRVGYAPNDIPALEKLAEEMYAKWSRLEHTRARFGKIMADVCARLATFEPDDQFGQKARARGYALRTLREADQFDDWIDWKLVTYVRTGPTPATIARGAAWSRQRGEEMAYWFHAIRRVQQAIDPQWDPGRIDFTSRSGVRPPRGVGFFVGGMSPEGIKDPLLRKQYADAIAENSRRTRLYQRQRDLRKLRDEYFPLAEKYIVTAYSCPPLNTDELRSNLDKYQVEAGMRDRILKAVEEKARQTGPRPAGK